ncbi:sigma54 specific transcriptional regulator, fis family [Yoonia vestfoldensis SKA53]|uniref:Sigma54 specific transcriptional regulator, fis family n=1 Tax=Yoonia vestfoldensis SKA53 TaxID=314232 RepID=A3V252_9RHOB|nr:sigma54 specific transcriptional regulator, fis family [Yoonia vestfoldensis SKA53]
MLEAELFGHEKGSFTGAATRRVGRFEEAAGGTLFLDEIGDLPLELQGKLLRAIEARAVSRIGSNTEQPIDFRLVCATHQNIGDKVDKGEFRQDLMYRISVVMLQVPSLQDRISDLPELVRSISDGLETDGSGLVPPKVSSDGLEEMMAYAWPGNIRELRNFFQRAAVLSTGVPIDRNVVRKLLHLPLDRLAEQKALWTAIDQMPDDDELIIADPVAAPLESADQSMISMLNGDDQFNLQGHLSAQEAKFIELAMELCNYNTAKAAKRLSLKRTTLIAKMRKYGISSDLPSENSYNLN